MTCLITEATPQCCSTRHIALDAQKHMRLQHEHLDRDLQRSFKQRSSASKRTLEDKTNESTRAKTAAIKLSYRRLPSYHLSSSHSWNMDGYLVDDDGEAWW